MRVRLLIAGDACRSRRIGFVTVTQYSDASLQAAHMMLLPTATPYTFEYCNEGWELHNYASKRGAEPARSTAAGGAIQSAQAAVRHKTFRPSGVEISRGPRRAGPWRHLHPAHPLRKEDVGKPGVARLPYVIYLVLIAIAASSSAAAKADALRAAEHCG